MFNPRLEMVLNMQDRYSEPIIKRLLVFNKLTNEVNVIKSDGKIRYEKNDYILKTGETNINEENHWK